MLSLKCNVKHLNKVNKHIVLSCGKLFRYFLINNRILN